MKVDPMAMPNICVCAAPDTPTAHKSEFMLEMAGATAVGGGDFTVVVAVELVVDVDLLVESVIMGSVCAAAIFVITDKNMPAQNLFFKNICFFLRH
jgi:hypothetical protein